MLGGFLEVSARKTPSERVFDSFPGGIRQENSLGGLLNVFGSFPGGIRQEKSLGICWKSFWRFPPGKLPRKEFLVVFLEESVRKTHLGYVGRVSGGFRQENSLGKNLW